MKTISEELKQYEMDIIALLDNVTTFNDLTGSEIEAEVRRIILEAYKTGVYAGSIQLSFTKKTK